MPRTNTHHGPHMNTADMHLAELIATASQQAANQPGATYIERLENALKALGCTTRPA
ncbi:hypothetical protein [Bifidobacterium pseudolongum]|uniref:Uncharacterized protein n=1 Tax=Bifidobacterium pseudolongum subsp. globosum TaxID=1690 RepID=A0A4Q5AQU7_9BIFI|nr:hypothetical protein [Bifidobacterium pseudolongum]RYQ36309.1 hypothetical protein PG2003B_1146 [Bifidobacterium pseudolongum subsp. globosum]